MIKTFSQILLLPLLFASSVFAQIQSGLEYDVYFLTGQSNASGRGDAAELPNLDGGLYSTPQTDVAFYYHQTLTNGAGQINTAIPEDVFQPLQAGSGHGFNSPSSHPSEFGPELSLGRALADDDPSRNIAIIKYGHGGSNLHTQWAAGGIYYTEFLDVVNDSLNDITNAGATFNLQGLSWVQGESDTSTANSTAYQSNLTNFVSRVRNDVFGGQTAPIVVTRLSANQYSSLGTGVVNVRNAQSAVAAADPFVFATNSDGAEFSTYNISNPIHFDARGNISQGLAIADAFINAPPTPPIDPEPPFIGSTVYTIGNTTNFGDNGFNAGGGIPTLTDNLDGTFTLANAPASGANNAVYIESGPNDINTLANSALGRPVLPTDTVVVSGTIDSSNINPHSNGFEFGIQSATGFRSQPNLLFQIDDNGIRGGRAPFFGTPAPGTNTNYSEAPGVTEASLLDGFSFTATYSASEIVWEVTDIITTNETGGETVGDTSLSFTFTDTDYQNDFTSLVGEGFAYFSAQKTGSNNDTTISRFQIEVLAEGLLCDLDADGDCDPTDIDLLYQTSAPDIAAWLDQSADTTNPWKTDTARNPNGTAADIYLLGDINLNGDVDSTDLGLLLNNFGNSAGLPPNGVGWSGGDLDANGSVDSTDLGLLLNNFGFQSAASAVVPEPQPVLLIGWGLIAFAYGLRRRH